MNLLLFPVSFSRSWIPPISGAVILPVAAKRSKDTTLHKHLRWFFVFAIFTVGLVIVARDFGPSPGIAGTTYAQQLVTLIAILVGGYALYRSAKSLVPLNKLPQEARSE
jgi:hypothetical protein